MYIALEAKEEKFEIEKSSLREKLQRIEVLSEAGRELIALGLARFTTAETANKVLQHLESKQLNESDLRTVFVLNSELNGDLIRELLRAGKTFSVIFIFYL